MVPSPVIREVFGTFQNLNLLALIHDLAHDGVARSTWSTGSYLCPLAHGLGSGEQVQTLKVAEQTIGDGDGSDDASHYLGVSIEAVARFVRMWDEGFIGSRQLLEQLRELWCERLEDAVAVQECLEAGEENATCILDSETTFAV